MKNKDYLYERELVKSNYKKLINTGFETYSKTRYCPLLEITMFTSDYKKSSNLPVLYTIPELNKVIEISYKAKEILHDMYDM